MPEKMKSFFRNSHFVRGMVRVLDLGCSFDRVSSTEYDPRSDWERIGEDWKKVGDDFKYAINRYRRENTDVFQE